MDLSTPVATLYHNKMRWVRHVARIGKNINAYMVCSRKRKRTPREVTVWDDNIKCSLRDYTGKGVECIRVTLYRDHCLELGNIVMIFPVK